MDALPEVEKHRLVTIERACAILGAVDATGNIRPIHPSTYYRGVAAGRYPQFVRMGGRSLVPELELWECINASLVNRERNKPAQAE